MKRNKTAERILLVDLDHRLPDVDSYEDVPREYERYGRCAILRGGAFWFGEVNSSHPPSTQEGFYWAVSGNVLHISPRGARYGFRDFNYQDAMEVVSELSDLMRSTGEGLETRVWTARGNGATYRDGENLVIRFFANRPCFIKVYHIDVNRKTSLIFPNDYYSDNRIEAGKIYSIPDDHYPFRFELGAPYGTEFIKVIASTRQFEDIEEAFSDLGEADGRVMTRGLAVKQRDELRSEEMISYTIVE